MFARRKILFSIILCLLAIAPACKKWKVGPGCTIRVDNQTGGTMRNLEVSYPGGYFGIPTLGADQVHMRWVAAKPEKGCHFVVKFEDNVGKQFVSHDFGFEQQSCPLEIAFLVDANRNVSSQVTKVR